MKKSISFWESLEQYSWKLVGRSPLPQHWPWIGVVLIVVVLLASVLNMKNSTVGANDLREVITLAAERGDYVTARMLWNNQSPITNNQTVLGAESELEDGVYPERVVTRRIAELEIKLAEYPENKEVYLMLASWYGQLGNTEKASEYREKARILDPNDPQFQ